MRTVPATMHGLRRVAVATLAALLLISLGACSSHDSTSPQATGAPTAAGSPSTSTTPSPSATSPAPTSMPTAPSASKAPLPKGVSTAKPKDPLATAAVQQVSRDGKKPHPTIRTTTNKQSFTKPITYTDGLQIKVTKVTQGKMSGHGPGVYPGRPVTTFKMTLINASDQSLDLGVVVVTVTYGSPSRVAHHIYDDQSIDFNGVVRPGASTKAVYGFSIPAGSRKNVTMTLDIDGRHHLAVFHGAVK